MCWNSLMLFVVLGLCARGLSFYRSKQRLQTCALDRYGRTVEARKQYGGVCRKSLMMPGILSVRAVYLSIIQTKRPDMHLG